MTGIDQLPSKLIKYILGTILPTAITIPMLLNLPQLCQLLGM